MITINNDITSFEAYLYGPDDNYIGLITNIISLDDVRRQIMIQRLSGYYVKINDQIVRFDNDGRPLDQWPKEFNGYEDILIDLVTYNPVENA